MKPLTIMFFIAAAGLLAVVTGVPRSHFISAVGRAGAGGASTLQDMQSGRRATSSRSTNSTIGRWSFRGNRSARRTTR